MATATIESPVLPAKRPVGSYCLHTDVLHPDQHAHPMNNGTFTVQNNVPDGFNPNETADVLKAVDKAFAAIKPTKEFPNRPYPVKMLVNARWRELQPALQTWSVVPRFIVSDNGDINETQSDCPIMLGSDAELKDAKEIKDSKARFVFIGSDNKPLTGA